MGASGYENGFKLSLMPERLGQPLQCHKPTMYFVNSMSDLFQDGISETFIDQVMDVIVATAWLGVSVEDRKYGKLRIPNLLAIKAKTRFLSVEPLLEDLGRIRLNGIHCVIVGGESGFGARAMKEEWAISIRNQCIRTEVDFFFKQWGAWGADGKQRNKKANGRLLDGKVWDMMPSVVV